MASLMFVMAMMNPQGGGQGGSEFLIMMLLIFAVMYFLIFRPQARKQKQQKLMLENVKKGDKIITTGGIHGTVVGVKDKTLLVKIAENVKIELNRSSIAMTLSSDDKTDGN